MLGRLCLAVSLLVVKPGALPSKKVRRLLLEKPGLWRQPICPGQCCGKPALLP